MSLKERIKRLEEKDKPREISSWLDIAKLSLQKGEGEIRVNRAMAEFIKRVGQNLKRSTHL